MASKEVTIEGRGQATQTRSSLVFSGTTASTTGQAPNASPEAWTLGGDALAGMILGGEVCIWRRKADLKGKMRDCPGDSSGREQGVWLHNQESSARNAQLLRGRLHERVCSEPSLGLGKGWMLSALCASLKV